MSACTSSALRLPLAVVAAVIPLAAVAGAGPDRAETEGLHDRPDCSGCGGVPASCKIAIRRPPGAK